MSKAPDSVNMASIHANEAARLLARAAAKIAVDRANLIWELDEALSSLAAAADQLGYNFTKGPAPTPVATPEAA